MKKRYFTIVGLFVLPTLFGVETLANTVTPDSTFNGSGYSTHIILPYPNYSIGRSFAIQADGKIVIAGDIVRNNQQDEFVLVRINADGTRDTLFGTDGIVTPVVGTSDKVTKVRIQPDGKILVAGSSWPAGGTDFNIMVLRYNTVGTLDTTFNSVGYVTHNSRAQYWDYTGDFALLPEGKIVLVGSSHPSIFEGDILIMRLNADGTLDTTFDDDGILIIEVPAGAAATQVIILSNGKYLIAGYRHDGVKPNFLLMRLHPDGTFDTSFGTGGSTTTSVSSGSNYILGADRQSDGKIVVTGSEYLARYTPDGILDTSFGTGGKTFISFDGATNIRVAHDDKILVSLRGVHRFMPNGARDTHFNDGGFRRMGVGANCLSGQVEIATDGKVLLGGQCSGSGASNITVARYQETRTKRFMDYSGDGKTDISIFRPSSGQWWTLDSFNLAFQSQLGPFGIATDTPVPADFTGDGRTDVAVFRPSTGVWWVMRSEDSSHYAVHFGTSGDVPVAADFDGDDKADVAVFRPSTNVWYVLRSTGGVAITSFGQEGDIPVPSDYDGDFKTDIAVYRPSTGEWWVERSSDGGYHAFHFGASADIPLQGDYTGDGKSDAAVWRPSTGEWYVRRSEDGSYYGGYWGINGDIPIPGNYAGDARSDWTVFRPSNNTWYVQPPDGNYFSRVFGQAGDQPLPVGTMP